MKQKPIDLGVLQDQFDTARKQFISDAKALSKAQDAHDRSRKAYLELAEQLKQASRSVLDGA